MKDEPEEYHGVETDQSDMNQGLRSISWLALVLRRSVIQSIRIETTLIRHPWRTILETRVLLLING
jgi:hypothetical protein